MVPESDVVYARRFCGDRGIRLIEVEAREFSIEAFSLNQKDRCYHCKKNIV
jgi:PP-loop superfamily ATP-utilizing enzyme